MMTPTFAGGLLFSQMENGDKVQVTAQSSGCFHNTVSYYQVSREEGGYTFTQYRILWGGTAGARKIVTKVVVGRISIGREDIAGLDGLLEYYRAEKNGASTSKESLAIQFRDRNGLVVTEKLVDHSGDLTLQKQEGVVTFHELTRRFPPKTAE